MNPIKNIIVYLMALGKMAPILNPLYVKHKVEAYKRMKTSELKRLNFARQATVEKSIRINKAIGLVEMLIFHKNDEIAKEIEMEFSRMLYMAYGEYMELIEEKDGAEFMRRLGNLGGDDKVYELLMVLYIRDREMYYKNTPPEIDYVTSQNEIWLRDSSFKPEEYQKRLEQATALRKEHFSRNEKLEDYSTSLTRKRENLFTESTSLLFEYFNIAPLQEDIKINKKDFLILCTMATYVEEIDREIFLYAGYLVMIYSKLLERDKALFFATDEEIMTLEERYQREQRENTAQELKSQEHKIKALEKELERTRKEYRASLEQELKAKDKEIAYLTELLDQEAEEEENQQQAQEVEKLEPFTLDDEIVVAGGYPALIARLKTYFPNLISVENNPVEVQRHANKTVYLLSRYTAHKVFFALKGDMVPINSRGTNQIAYEIKNKMTPNK